VGNITSLSVFETVGDHDPLPGFSGGGHEGGELGVFLKFPSGVGGLLGGNELAEESLVLGLGVIARLNSGGGVGIEGSLLDWDECSPVGEDLLEVSLEVGSVVSAGGVSGGSGGGEGLV
jgi:hypothetical protein